METHNLPSVRAGHSDVQSWSGCIVLQHTIGCAGDVHVRDSLVRFATIARIFSAFNVHAVEPYVTESDIACMKRRNGT